MSSHDNTKSLRHLMLAPVIPLFLAAGMALAYLGAFHNPTPHHVQVELAASSPRSVQPLASALEARLGARFDLTATCPARPARPLTWHPLASPPPTSREPRRDCSSTPRPPRPPNRPPCSCSRPS